jgi:hypothetical protein
MWRNIGSKKPAFTERHDQIGALVQRAQARRVEIGKDFMSSHGYIKNDFEVRKWAAPEFLEAAAKELIAERWKKVTADKLPEATALRLG